MAGAAQRRAKPAEADAPAAAGAAPSAQPLRTRLRADRRPHRELRAEAGTVPGHPGPPGADGFQPHAGAPGRQPPVRRHPSPRPPAARDPGRAHRPRARAAPPAAQARHRAVRHPPGGRAVGPVAPQPPPAHGAPAARAPREHDDRRVQRARPAHGQADPGGGRRALRGAHRAAAPHDLPADRLALPHRTWKAAKPCARRSTAISPSSTRWRTGMSTRPWPPPIG